MKLKPISDYQESDFCRVYRCDDFANLGSLQVVFLVDKQPDDEGQDLPCLSVKTNVKGALITAHQFFRDSEEGEESRDEMLRRMDSEKGAAWIEKILLEQMLTLLDAELGKESTPPNPTPNQTF